jgi:CBS domain-containing protein
MLAIVDLLRAIMPAYLSAPKPSMADAIQYSPMFWRGAFNREIELVARRPVGEIMSPAPMTINDDANLMEAAYTMVTNKLRRMVVMRGGEVAGHCSRTGPFLRDRKGVGLTGLVGFIALIAFSGFGR